MATQTDYLCKTADTSYTVPAGVTSLQLDMWEAGGQGASGATVGGTGGAGGAAAEWTGIPVIPGSVITVTIPAGSATSTRVTVTIAGTSYYVTTAGGSAASPSPAAYSSSNGSGGSAGSGIDGGAGGASGTTSLGGGTGGAGGPGQGDAGQPPTPGNSLYDGGGSNAPNPGGGGGGGGKFTAGGAGAAGGVAFTYTLVTAIAEADEGAAADQMAAQITAIPPAVIAAPPRPSGPAPPPVPAQLLTVPAGAAMPQDAAGAAEAMAAGTVTVPLADAAGAAEFFSGGVMPADQAAASDALAVAAGIALPDPAGAATDLAGNVAAVQVSASDYGAAADLFQNTGLTEADAGAAADSLTAAVTVHIAEVAAAARRGRHEPAIGASGGATIPRASPGTSQVAVAAPGTDQWYYLGSYGVLTALTYSYTCPGGCDSMTCTLMVPASYRNQIMDPSRWPTRPGPPPTWPAT